ncbi:MAG: preprotein translocase subunit SecE [Solirubrobacteraceae bacterium]
MARNRKRAKDRRTRPPGTGPDPHQGVPTAMHDVAAGGPEREPDNGVAERETDNGSAAREPDNGAAGLEPVDLGSDPLKEHEEGAPPPLEHAMPDVELAEEQLAFGRPAAPEPEDEEDEEEYEREVEESIAEAGSGRQRRGGYDRGSAARGSGGAGELAAPAAAVPARAPSVFVRLIGFLQGSWRELHRVQWPDRRQVMQATGVVIGFVIIAAVFLGVSDWVSGKIVTFVLK